LEDLKPDFDWLVRYLQAESLYPALPTITVVPDHEKKDLLPLCELNVNIAGHPIEKSPLVVVF